MELTKTITHEASNYFWNKIKRAKLDDETKEKINEMVTASIEYCNDIMWELDRIIDRVIESENTPRITQEEELAMRNKFIQDYQIDWRI